MSKHVSPLLGYNNNVRHKNRVFHIQTEDSGVKHPHIITHLFMDGGRILKSIKRSYAEHVGADKMQETVKQMMKEQHKAMFISLRDGQFDHLVEDGGEKKAAAAKAANDAKPSDAPAELVMKTSNDLTAIVASAKIKTEPAPPLPPPSSASVDVDIDDHDMVPMTTRTPELMLDIDSLQNASAQGAAPRQLSDLPPPPANLFREKSAASGAYRNAAPVGETATGKKSGSSPPKKASIPPKKPASTPPRKSPSAHASDARYAAARPAAIFGQAGPQQGSSIFGEDLISDKSLDEVILSYLAEDLEPPPSDKKK
jgi:hypothetical protein